MLEKHHNRNQFVVFCRKLALKLGKKANFKEISVQAIQLWPIDGKWCVNYKNQKKNFQPFPFNECTPSRNPIKIAYLSVKMTEPTKDLSQ